MAHPIDTDESVRHAIRRLARAGLSKAIRRIEKPKAPLDEQIHEARTAIKKVRALTRLVRPAASTAAGENRRLRRVARSLSELRDARVQERAFRDLLRGYAGASDDSVTEITTFLSGRLENARRDFDRSHGLKQLRHRLRKARRRVKNWLPTNKRWRALGPGLVHGYTKAQQAMTDAYCSKDDLAFHTWRRTVKSHRHHVHALLHLFPEDFKLRLEQLDKLDQWLGDEHDLSALKQTLKQAQARVHWNQRCESLAKELNERRARLRSQAHELGEQLFSRAPKTLRNQLKTHLKKAA